MQLLSADTTMFLKKKKCFAPENLKKLVGSQSGSWFGVYLGLYKLREELRESMLEQFCQRRTEQSRMQELDIL